MTKEQLAITVYPEQDVNEIKGRLGMFSKSLMFIQEEIDSIEMAGVIVNDVTVRRELGLPYSPFV